MKPENNTCVHGYGFGQLLLALLGGAVAGAAAAYLTAPRSGAATRARLRGMAEDTRDAVERVPAAVRKATLAAREAFNDALEDSAAS